MLYSTGERSPLYLKPMTKALDITGQRFERLVLLREDPDSKRHWFMQCDCGKQKRFDKYNVLNGRTRSCGCIRKEQCSERQVLDLTGHRFGELVVAAPHQERTSKKGMRWICQCDCGNTSVHNAVELRAGKATTCGHWRELGDLVGQRFGALVVMALTPQDKTRQSRLWECKCDCGQLVLKETGVLSSGAATSCGCLGRGEDTVAGWLTNQFRKPEVQAFFYVYQMANHPGLCKPGIAMRLSDRADNEYGNLFDSIKAPRIDVWLIEQALLFETRAYRECPARLCRWAGHTELRKIAPAVLFGMACGYHEELQRLGREDFALRYLPTTPKQRAQLEAMKPELIAA